MDGNSVILQQLLAALRNATRDGTLVLSEGTLGDTGASRLMDLLTLRLKIASFTMENVALPPSVDGSSFEVSGDGGGVALGLTFLDVSGEVAIEALFRAGEIAPLQRAFPELPAGFFDGIEVSGSTASVRVPGLVSNLTFASAHYSVAGLVTPSSGLVTTSIAPRVDGRSGPGGGSGELPLLTEVETATTGYRLAPLEGSWTFSDLGWLMPGLSVLSALREVFRGRDLGLRTFDLRLYTYAADLSSISLAVADALNPDEPLWSGADGKVKLTEVVVNLDLTYSGEGTLALTGTGSLQGTFSLGSLVLTAAIPVPPAGIWSLTAYPNVPLPTLADIATLVAGGEGGLANALPARLGDVGRFEFSYLRLAVDASSLRLVEFTIALSSASPWRIVEDWVTLSSLLMTLTIDGTPEVTGSVTGTVGLGDQGAEIIISLGRSSPQQDWRLDVISPAIPLPSLGELAELVKGEDLASLVKAGGLDELGFVMTDLNIGVRLTPSPELTNVGLTLQLASSRDSVIPKLDWQIIPGVLALTRFSFGFQIDWGEHLTMNKPVTKKAFGAFVLNGLEFAVKFVSQSGTGASADALIAEYSAEGDAGTVNVKDLINSIADGVADGMPDIWITVADAMLAYLTGSDGAKKFLFAMDIAVELPISDLPIVGKALPPDATVGVKNLKVVVTSAALSALDVAAINTMANRPVLATPGEGGADEAIPAGFSMVAELELGVASILLTSPPVRQGQHGQGREVARRTAAGTDPVMWIQVQKTFGPVQVQKIGFSYVDGGLFVVSNLSIAVGGLEIDLLGIGVGSRIKDPGLLFTIQGLAVSFEEGPISIKGGMLGRLKPPDFVGVLSVRAPQLSLSAFAGYTEYQEYPSFFLYGVLDVPIGGPPPFFVTGLAAGAGFNRKLLIPNVSGVATFPLVEWAVGAGAPPFDPSQPIGGQVAQALAKLAESGVVAPSVGDYWFAAGVRFTSFKIIDSFALLTVSLGASVEIALLGLSTLTIPPDSADPVAQVQLALQVAFNPAAGLLAVAGQLTANSYVLSRQCRLTGGFAFYLWFAGDFAGDTVLTLGGYNPNFAVPGHYPVVPRVGLSWQVVPQLAITGELYFALTSNVVMAGGKLSAVWNSGPISAWFTYWADFLMTFTPFHYFIGGGIDLGASFTVNLLFFSITVTIHIGVAVELWGPPFAGRATINLSIISFTISFNAHAPDTKTSVPWRDFVKQLLPGPPARRPARALRGRPVPRGRPAQDDEAPAAVVQITILDGLVRTLDPAQEGPVYLVTAETFQCAVLTVIPNKKVVFDPDPDHGHTGLANLAYAPDSEQPHDKHGNLIIPNTDFGAGPAGLEPGSFQPALGLKLGSPTTSVLHAYRRFSSAPKALWENKKFDDKTGVPEVDPATGLTDTTIPDALTGLTLIPYLDREVWPLAVPLQSLLFSRGAEVTFGWSPGVPPASDPFTDETVAGTIGTPVVHRVRDALLRALAGQGITVTTDVDVSRLADPATIDLEAAPRLRLLGEILGGLS